MVVGGSGLARAGASRSVLRLGRVPPRPGADVSGSERLFLSLARLHGGALARGFAPALESAFRQRRVVDRRRPERDLLSARLAVSRAERGRCHGSLSALSFPRRGSLLSRVPSGPRPESAVGSPGKRGLRPVRGRRLDVRSLESLRGVRVDPGDGLGGATGPDDPPAARGFRVFPRGRRARGKPRDGPVRSGSFGRDLSVRMEARRPSSSSRPAGCAGAAGGSSHGPRGPAPFSPPSRFFPFWIPSFTRGADRRCGPAR